ncbi:MAG: COG4223 family protein [Ignavibacteriales bacterium]
MTLAPDPTEISPPDFPDVYARPRRKGLGGGWIVTLCLVSVMLGAGVGAYVWSIRPFRHVAASPAPAQANRTLAEATTAAPPETAIPPAPPAPDVSSLESRVQALETSQNRTVDAAAAALASALLAEAADSSRPFDRELAAMERVMPLSPDAMALRRLAQTGAPTKAALAAGFDDAAARASVAARDPGERAGFLDRLGFALANIVTVRRVGSLKGDTPDAVLARAERQVNDGDVDGALVTLNALPPGAAAAMADWRLGAERRATIDRRVASIRATALANLAAVSRPSA